ncbi:hypothetical protein CN311_06200 [Mesorhizobium sanjuanii]|uniref:ATP nucleosidase Cap17-like N-terminal domain-containing protein n=1 Tax=Mesorhizobium sanjuanii TaxID=2037900 RepID=A0A2A6FJ80_9HYPH|nr:hypothetical protein [Mesorhizobium sanjuanii]PDQ22007.1 hypothetical protein CN311_06200 [Mesorhizobium sanjuanii]
MARSNLFGRRIHISGSIAKELEVASGADVEHAQAFVAGLVKELIKRGANFVVPVDAQPVRDVDGQPICFDWLIWETIQANILSRPAGVSGHMVVAVQHHKTENQIPEKYRPLWERLRSSDLVKVDNASFWNMASKRMEAQAHWGDILIPVGGTEGVLFLTNLYHDVGKHIVPVNLPISAESTGARKVFSFGLGRHNTKHLFRTTGIMDPHGWINRINFTPSKDVAGMVADFVDLLEALERPRAFAVRLLNPEHVDYAAVQDFFDVVVKPVFEDELGFRLVVVDGRQAVEHSRVDADIFGKLHRSQVVIADITGSRPNCFLELGYALGRTLPTIVTAMAGSQLPFDITTFSGYHWKTSGSADERRRALLEHWRSVESRPPIVDTEPLIS